MYKYYIVPVLAIALNFTSAKAITRDSIGVENRNGKKLIIHQVAAKDTYYSIARKYNVIPKDIMTFNDSKFLQIGVIVKVPTNIPFKDNAGTAGSRPGNTPAQAVENIEEHIVQKKENLNMLAERYGTTVNEIKRINNLNSINLQIGQVLKIPGKVAEQEKPVETVSEKINRPDPKPVVLAEKREPAKPIEKPVEKQPLNNPPKAAEEEFIEHTVASNETMYSIATRYKITMDQLKAKNNLKDASLSVGQKLLIKGQYPVKKPYTPPIAGNTADQDSVNSLKDPSLRYAASRYGLNQIEEKGTAVWIADPDLDPTKMLVLHRTAPIGKVIKITNPMSNRTTFAKVVGKFTENESTKDVIIVMTKAVADALGALDKRFYCNLMYGGEENEQ
ncbi:LysM peptidoglycan-binding domain-containing protein [Pedobacter frigoris]|uniref:LysM peptidoglycan-binding domain-containing protein n=1 Tax=Pedobacter frigoris TaxID=2571272 RepID=A0A4U1CH65_9SPHI|nr:LysM peptidoglycan-binding domain-containing protein [Pedobacter frigoris]TKC06115.1 LysM peptidoglycan-binding domain-containing protein [Pedobacter frigoris]